jgi:DNA primase
MSWESAAALKRQTPLQQYLESQHWKPVRRMAGGRLLGLCPLHPDRQPSFLVDPARSLFYCYGCGRGGDVIRFVELYHGVRFAQAMALLRASSASATLLKDAASFYHDRLVQHPEAIEYLQQRGIRQPEVIDELAVGYASGGRRLRHWLLTLGYSLEELQQSGLVNAAGYDAFRHRITFPLEANLYGRATGQAAPHRFLPAPKGGLYRWNCVRHCPDLILVEGLFDLASLCQAGFRNVTCSMGSRLNAAQLAQLCDDIRRTVYVAFDSDINGSGQAAALQLADVLSGRGLAVRQVGLPHGHDPNSFFVNGGSADQFRRWLREARP